MNLSTPPSMKNVINLCGTNNLLHILLGRWLAVLSCLREKSSNINFFVCWLIPKDESWSVNRVLIKDFSRIFEYLCLKHDFYFIDQSNRLTFSNGDLDPSLFFRDSFHIIEEGNVKLAKLLINSTPRTNSIYFSSKTCGRYSCSDTCKNKASVSLA